MSSPQAQARAGVPPGHELKLPHGECPSIPADQLKRLGVSLGTHLRVVETPASASAGSIAGSLSHLADVSWEDFERASKLAREDVVSA